MTVSTLRSYMTRREVDLVESEVTVARVTLGTFDPDTGTRAADDSTTIYSGRAQIRAADTGTDEDVVDVGDHQTRWLCKIPASETGVQVGDRVTVDDSPDAGMVGRVLRVEHVGAGDWKSSVTRRLTLIDDLP